MSTKTSSRSTPTTSKANVPTAIELTPDVITAAVLAVRDANEGECDVETVRRHVKYECITIAADLAVKAWLRAGGQWRDLADFMDGEFQRIAPIEHEEIKLRLGTPAVRDLADRIVAGEFAAMADDLVDEFTTSWLFLGKHASLRRNLEDRLASARLFSWYYETRANTYITPPTSIGATWGECCMECIADVADAMGADLAVARPFYERLCAFLAKTSDRKAA